ncbi:methyl-accepting chemotaxis protein [Ideonella livida]|uniref:HAMP domain-containing protein n=1 Tax=Ideonella livida TaxID=2707176 RepID=A0A7C9PK43_9BURK|nr:methyl-accepting chemotaxis protein [Ideonella livida]NDY93012.1 HAMP domain-containing protein [Ideonella livida]
MFHGVQGWMRRWRIRTRLFWLGGLGGLAVLLGLGLALWLGQGLTVLSQRVFVSKDVVADILPPPLYLVEMRLVVSQVAEGSLPLAQGRTEVARLRQEYEARATFWREHPPHGLETSLLGAQHRAGLAFMDGVAQLLALPEEQALTQLRAGLPELQRQYAEHRAGVDETVRQATAMALADMAAFEQMVAQSRQGSLLAGGLLLAAVLGLAGLLAATVLEPLRRAVRAVQQVAGGDLAAPVDVAGADELTDLGRALQAMQQELATMVQHVQRDAQQVAVASEQIATGNRELKIRTESQAGAVQETAAIMEELHCTLNASADNARQVCSLTQQASAMASRGGEVVGQVVGTMQGIQDASRRVGDILGVIDGIAFQTNILALNAAVEAARAGEAGKGFAVVASEVRMLAGRSAEAAREIKRLMHDSSERVERGGALVEAAGAAMGDIVRAIQQVNERVVQISDASLQQNAGVAQMGVSIDNLNAATQQNAVMVEQAASATMSLHGQADGLVQSVARFRLQGQGEHAD